MTVLFRHISAALRFPTIVKMGSFATIGVVAAAGYSAQLRNYNFTDVAPQKPVNFYRLVQIDADGTKKYSDTHKLIFNADSKAFIILVNPAQRGTLQVQFNQPCTALIYNTTGQLMISQQVSAGSKELDVGLLAKGIYILQAGNQKERFTVE